jgi:hypothetical protein
MAVYQIRTSAATRVAGLPKHRSSSGVRTECAAALPLHAKPSSTPHTRTSQ